MPLLATILIVVAAVLLIVVPLVVKFIFGPRLIGNTEVGVVEKTWGGHVHNRIIALKDEAGFQPEVLRGGLHWRRGFQYKVHRVPLVTIHRGQIGYVFARDGQPLGRFNEDGHEVVEAGQTLGRVVDAPFTDVRA